MNKLVVIVGVVFVLGVGGSFFWLWYSIDKANIRGMEMKCRENMEEEFSGTIHDINRYEYDEFMHKNVFCLDIKPSDTLNKFTYYQFNLKPNKELLQFAQVGQAVVKVKGEDVFTIVSKTGQQQKFKIPQCGPLE